MAREEDKHRGPEYVPAGPVRIVPDLSVRLAETERVLVHTIARIAVLESQVKSLQMSPSLPRGIPT